MQPFRVALGQINPTVGDLEGNSQKIREFLERARSLGTDLVVLPELAVSGYPPEDLLLKPRFVQDVQRTVSEIVKSTSGTTAVIGFVHSDSDLFNAAAVAHDGSLAGVYHKMHLPNYGVFDENRYFRRGSEIQIYSISGAEVGISICEDIWQETGPVGVQASGGANILVNASASPYHAGRVDERRKLLEATASVNVAAVAYCNLVGGQDELVFDGGSMIIDHRGETLARGNQFEEDLVIADLDIGAIFSARLHDPRWRNAAELLAERGQNIQRIHISEAPTGAERPPIPAHEVKDLDRTAEIYGALVLGTKDYVRKNGFQKVLIALSGGIDSSLVAAIAVDALGKENVVGLSMPSRYSSKGSVVDAKLLAERLGMRLISIPIEEVYGTYLKALGDIFEGTERGVAEENLQARTRGDLAMALSNKFGWLVLATGNKSEMATGYSTLYGDMCGGLAVIKDVPKTVVYELSRFRNSISPAIPESVLTKPPSAELRPDQRDTDSLPPYEVLDPILEAYVEQDKSIQEITSMGFDEETVRTVTGLVDRSEFKRRQSTPGIKITPRAFGRDRRLPITNRYRQ